MYRSLILLSFISFSFIFAEEDAKEKKVELPDTVKLAESKFLNDVNKHYEDYLKEVMKEQNKLRKVLEKELKKETKKGNLEVALAIKNRITYLEEKGVKENICGHVSIVTEDNKNENWILGEWEITWDNGKTNWTVKEDNTFVSSSGRGGTYKLNENVAIFKWKHGPITEVQKNKDGTITGKDSKGKLTFTAKK